MTISRSEMEEHIEFLLKNPGKTLGSVYHDAGSSWELIERLLEIIRNIQEKSSERMQLDQTLKEFIKFHVEQYIDSHKIKSFPSIAGVLEDGIRLGVFFDSVTRKKDFTSDLSSLINLYSKENGSNTPDFILAEYLILCLENFDKTSRARENWYGRSLQIVDT